MSDEVPPPAGGDGQSSSGQEIPPPGEGVASSKSSLTEAESLLIDMMKRQATVKAPSSGADILAAGRMIGKDGDGGDKTDGGGKKHAFWETQPMKVVADDSKKSGGKRTGGKNSDPMNKETAAAAAAAAAIGADGEEQTTTTTMQHCPIVPNKPTSELRQDPYNMPKGFEWSTIDVMDEAQRDEVYDLLTRNYVEDDDAMFRFDYSPPFLLWALTPPDFNPDFHLGVRSSKSGKLMAFITAVPAHVRAYEKTVPMVEINFLCVHKKLRSKRLAPVLIKEITRRVNLTGVFQAVYTAGVVLPVPVASCRYYHRSLNPKKLVDIGFSRLAARMTMARMIKLYKVPEKPATTGLRPMEMRDVPSAHRLLDEYLTRFSLCVKFSVDEFAHWLMPRKGVITTYVATKKSGAGGDDEEETVTDLISFYHLPSTITNHPRHSTLCAGYSFYNVATSVDAEVLMRDALILAKNEGMDVFNALNLMENEKILKDLKFGIGDGELQYYLYNWACPEMEPKDVGIVLL